MIKLFSPGIGYYARQIMSGVPFALARYGEGEWKPLVPAIPLRKKSQYWNRPEERAKLQKTLIECYRDENYKVAMWHQRHIAKEMNCQAELEAWIRENVPLWVRWYNGRIWRTTVERDQLYPLIHAMQEQKLPILLVGPRRIAPIKKVGFPVARHIITNTSQTWWERDEIEKKILEFGKPALISFSAGCATKVLIHNLWPVIGQHSYLIDFGAMWDGMCGLISRGFHRKLTPARIRKNLEGR
jgi:hypothetical protein